jgi:mannose-6-phosphate isomerase-like protein (cupin superfamily)
MVALAIMQPEAAGDMCFFPADQMHTFTVTSDAPVKLLVIYSPPYGESPGKVIRPSQTAQP